MIFKRIHAVDLVYWTILVASVSFYAGVALHSYYTGYIRKQLWTEAVEHGYAEEIDTSEGKAFIWKSDNKYPK